MDPVKRRVSLVLGSGGARGLAHIGVIKWLCAQGYAIESIAGTSMGALIGGIYATGKLDVYADWVRALERRDVIRLLDFSWRRAGLFKGERVVSALKSLVGEYDIGDLPISFTAVATDLESGKEVWLSRGPLFDAIRASISIPTIFTPYEINGRTLVDGGLVNPVPIAPTLRDMTDLTIAVTLSGPPSNPAPAASAEDKDMQRADIAYQRLIRDFVDSLHQRFGPSAGEDLGLLDVVTRSFETMQATVSRLKLAAHAPDVVISIPSNACRFFEFNRASEMIELGRRQAARALTKQPGAAEGG